MDAIRKKFGQRQGQAVQPVRGAEAGWRLAFGRAVRDAMGLDLQFTALRLQGLSLAELLEIPPERALIVMLEGPEGGLGLMVLSPGLMAGLIEMQTFGRLTANPPLVRRPTRTDAAMVSGLLDRALEGLAHTLETEPERVWTDGFRTTSFIEDPRPLGLLLEDVSYNVLSGHVLVGGGEKSGDLILALPAKGCGRQPEAHRPVSGEDEPGKGFLFRAALAEQVSQAEATLVAVIARVRMPLQQVLTLRAGDPVPLGTAAIDRVDLEGLDGVRLAGGKLGQSKGSRAVRLSVAAMPATRETVRATSSVAGPMAEAPALRPTGSGP
ncbi:MAG: FliM/FliN family flagellar motor switch protein [Pseudorhodobacter sp.]